MNGATQAAAALLFLRGLAIVGLTSANVAFIAHHHDALAVASSYGISLAWWGNSRETHRSRVRGAKWIYAAGAATGTLLALWVTR
ncbi:MAG: hypothetical protein RL328_713 [Acidobacteriota bacterium]